jgi:glycosyltransferase involved in cell wall biosynthesis
MRVALVTNLCTHYRRPLFEELGRRFDMSFFFTSSGSEWYWPSSNDAGSHGLSGVVGTRRKLARNLVQGNYECVIVGLAGRTVIPRVFLTAKATRLPFVLWAGLWEHPSTLFHSLSRPLTRRLYRSADALLVYGSHVAEFVAAEAGRTERVYVAPQAVDNALFRRPVPEQRLSELRRQLSLGEDPVVAYVGRLEEEKGLDTLLRASAAVLPSHTLLLIGSGSLERTLRDQAASLDSTLKVRFVGRVEPSDLPAFLGLTDVLVLPSVATPRVKEAWGLVVNEAMNCGIPVVATDAVGATAGGLVVHEETGLVVPERDAAALTGALDRLLSSPVLRHELGGAARRRVVDWSFGSAADAFERAVSAAVDCRRPIESRGP